MISTRVLIPFRQAVTALCVAALCEDPDDDEAQALSALHERLATQAKRIVRCYEETVEIHARGGISTDEVRACADLLPSVRFVVALLDEAPWPTKQARRNLGLAVSVSAVGTAQDTLL